MFRYSFISLLWLFLLASTSVFSESHSGYFTENKGQWHQKVKYKADLAFGAVYVESNLITYNFYDPQRIEAWFGHHHEVSGEIQDMNIQCHAIRQSFPGSNPSPSHLPHRPLPGYYNFIKGNDPSKWASRAKAFVNVELKELYPGIDLVLERTGDILKYDFVVHTGSNPSTIKVQYEGAEKVFIKNGELHVVTSVNEVIEQQPYAYQIIEAETLKVSCNFILNSSGEISFSIPDGFNENYDLIIDPTLVMASYSGSTSDNFGLTATFDSEGFLYSGSTSFGSGYPTTVGAYQTTWMGGVGAGGSNSNFGTDIAITKYDTSGQFLIFSTMIGGAIGDEAPHSLIVNSRDEVFIFGTSGSSDYPVTTNAYDTTFNGGTSQNLTGVGVGINFANGCDIIASRLSFDGTQLMASTFLGGTDNDGINYSPTDLKYNYADEFRGEIMIDASNNIYIATCTNSSDFPTTSGAIQSVFGGGALDGCVVKMDNELTTLAWSTYLGGSQNDAIYSLALDPVDNLYVTGGTVSTDFPIFANDLQPSYAGGRSDGFIAHIQKGGMALLGSTFFGSDQYDQCYFIETDDEGSVYVFGQTESLNNEFIYNAPYNSPNSGQFVSKLNPGLDSLAWSTTFGSGIGAPNISPSAFLVDVCNKIYIAGWGGVVNQLSYLNNNAGYTTNMDITPDAFQSTTDGSDFYLMVMDIDAAGIFYGSYFGGPTSVEHVDGGTSRFDRKGRMYESVCAGCGGNSDFPTTPGAWSATNNAPVGGRCNNGVFKFDFNLPIVIADFVAPPPGCAPYNVAFQNTGLSQGFTDYFWDFGDGDTSNTMNPSHTYSTSGMFDVMLVFTDTSACNYTDTIIKQLIIMDDSTYSIDTSILCLGGFEQIGILPLNDTGITYLWNPSAGLSNPSISNPLASPSSNTNYVLTISNGSCTDSVLQTVTVDDITIQTFGDTSFCSPVDSTQIGFTAIGMADSVIWSLFPDYSSPFYVGIDSLTYVAPDTGSTTYYVQVFTSNGCSAQDTVGVFLNPMMVNLNADTAICAGDTSIVAAVVSGLGAVYDWSPDSITGTSNDSVLYLNPVNDVWVFLTVTGTGGCSYEDSVEIMITGAVNMNAWGDTSICVAGLSTTLGASSGGSADSMIWSNTPNFSNVLNPGGDSSIMVTPDFGTNYYYVLGISEIGCTDVDTVQVNMNEVTVNLNGGGICEGDSSLITAVTNGIGLQYYWNTDSSIINNYDSAIVVAPYTDSWYGVMVTGSFNCYASDSILIPVVNLPSQTLTATSSEDTIFAGDTVQISATPVFSGFSFEWTPDSWLNDPTAPATEAFPQENIIYTATYFDSSNPDCKTSDQVELVVFEFICGPPYIYVPNAFTPNGDGANDVLYVRGRNIREMFFTVYDRWGEKVFETSDLDQGWDGTFRNEKLDPAVFVYYLTAICVDGQEMEPVLKGNVTLIR